MKTLIDTRIYALLSHNESNLLELTQAYEEFIETMIEMIANCNDRDEILRILHYGRMNSTYCPIHRLIDIRTMF